MAISVDTVYQRVLTLANKEQRGYITPQEFNLLANQAQTSIFESYFYSKNIRGRKDPDKKIEKDESDIEELLNQKLAPFLVIDGVTSGTDFQTQVSNLDVFQVGRIFFDSQVCQKVPINDAYKFAASTRHIAAATSQAPIYTDSIVAGEDISVYSGSGSKKTSGVTAEYFRVPTPAEWAYVVVNEKALYNSNVSENFELHKAEEDTLVNRILELAGIVINKPGLVQIAAQEDAAEQQFQNI